MGWPKESHNLHNKLRRSANRRLPCDGVRRGLTTRPSQPRHADGHVPVAIGEESKGLYQIVELVPLRDHRPAAGPMQWV